jgi:GNAT superfamily N-acetyltransferase
MSIRVRSEIFLKRATVDDLGSLLPLIREFNREDGIEVGEERLVPALTKMLTDPSLGCAWLILLGSERVGYAVLTFGYDMEYGGRDAWITDLYVRPESQGQGVGRAALASLETKALGLGVCALHLMVRNENERAKAVYAKQGFRPHPRIAMMKMLKS